MVGSGATYGFTVTATNPANGSLILTVPDGATTDPAGNPNLGATITIAIDRTPPKTSVPMTTLRTGGTFSGALAGLVSWSGSDLGGAGIASYDIERSRDGAAFAAPATGLASPQLIVSLSAGHTYRYAVRARDQAGNVGAWRAGPTFSTIVRQDSSG